MCFKTQWYYAKMTRTLCDMGSAFPGILFLCVVMMVNRLCLEQSCGLEQVTSYVKARMCTKIMHDVDFVLCYVYFITKAESAALLTIILFSKTAAVNNREYVTI